jgi:uncharacterized membrane protein
MPPNIHLLYKLLHLVAVILFLGNASLGLFWVAHAERSRDARLIGHAMDGVIRGDRWFTWPGVILILASGVAGAASGHLPLLRVGWIASSIALFSLSGLVFAIWLAPLQRKIVGVAATAQPDTTLLDALVRRWHVVGWFSLSPLWLAFAAMVLKWPG